MATKERLSTAVKLTTKYSGKYPIIASKWIGDRFYISYLINGTIIVLKHSA